MTPSTSADSTFNCPSCQHPLLGGPELSGQTVACPHCGGHLIVPQLAAPIVSTQKPPQVAASMLTVNVLRRPATLARTHRKPSTFAFWIFGGIGVAALTIIVAVLVLTSDQKDANKAAKGGNESLPRKPRLSSGEHVPTRPPVPVSLQPDGPKALAVSSQPGFSSEPPANRDSASWSSLVYEAAIKLPETNPKESVLKLYALSKIAEGAVIEDDKAVLEQCQSMITELTDETQPTWFTPNAIIAKAYVDAGNAAEAKRIASQLGPVDKVAVLLDLFVASVRRGDDDEANRLFEEVSATIKPLVDDEKSQAYRHLVAADIRALPPEIALRRVTAIRNDWGNTWADAATVDGVYALFEDWDKLAPSNSFQGFLGEVVGVHTSVIEHAEVILDSCDLSRPNVQFAWADLARAHALRSPDTYKSRSLKYLDRIREPVLHLDAFQSEAMSYVLARKPSSDFLYQNALDEGNATFRRLSASEQTSAGARRFAGILLSCKRSDEAWKVLADNEDGNPVHTAEGYCDFGSNAARIGDRNGLDCRSIAQSAFNRAADLFAKCEEPIYFVSLEAAVEEWCGASPFSIIDATRMFRERSGPVQVYVGLGILHHRTRLPATRPSSDSSSTGSDNKQGAARARAPEVPWTDASTQSAAKLEERTSEQTTFSATVQRTDQAVCDEGIGTSFSEAGEKNAEMVGVELTTARFGRRFQGTAIGAIRPLFRVDRRTVEGTWHGTKHGESHTIFARSGYSLSRLDVATGGRVMGLNLHFTNADGDSYSSGWIGERTDKITELQIESRSCIGMFGSSKREVSGEWPTTIRSLGLITLSTD